VQTNRSNTSGACGINVAATASAGLAASSPGGGQARKRRIDEESHGDDDYDDDDGDDVSSHGEGVSVQLSIILSYHKPLIIIHNIIIPHTVQKGCYRMLR